MPRTRLALVSLTVVVVLAACGSDEQQPAPPTDAETARSDSALVEDPEPADAPDQPDTAASDTAPVPRLGDRFEVCGDVQADRDAIAAALPELEAAQAAVRDARAAVAAATDDLDRAAANEALAEAETALWWANDAYDNAIHPASGELHHAMRIHAWGGTSTSDIVYGRAWEAFLGAADTRTLAAIAGIDATAAALEAAINARDAAERAYDEAHERALVEAEAAVTAADAAYEAAVAAFVEEHDVPESDVWRLVFPEDWPPRLALNEAWKHRDAVRDEATSGLVALRDTARDLNNALSDAYAAETDAQNTLIAALPRNVATHSPAYAAFLRSFYESCQQ